MDVTYVKINDNLKFEGPTLTSADINDEKKVSLMIPKAFSGSNSTSKASEGKEEEVTAIDFLVSKTGDCYVKKEANSDNCTKNCLFVIACALLRMGFSSHQINRILAMIAENPDAFHGYTSSGEHFTADIDIKDFTKIFEFTCIQFANVSTGAKSARYAARDVEDAKKVAEEVNSTGEKIAFEFESPRGAAVVDIAAKPMPWPVKLYRVISGALLSAGIGSIIASVTIIVQTIVSGSGVGISALVGIFTPLGLGIVFLFIGVVVYWIST
ncbi:MAG: hypothetical protein LBI69_05070 [Puniceicoccales bacterium]|nr:hypothetical protein [Puniceicoccales bacterium]